MAVEAECPFSVEMAAVAVDKRRGPRAAVLRWPRRDCGLAGGEMVEKSSEKLRSVQARTGLPVADSGVSGDGAGRDAAGEMMDCWVFWPGAGVARPTAGRLGAAIPDSTMMPEGSAIWRDVTSGTC